MVDAGALQPIEIAQNVAPLRLQAGLPAAFVEFLAQDERQKRTEHVTLNPAAVLIWAKDLGPPCNCGLRFRRAQAELAGSADDHAGTDAALH